VSGRGSGQTPTSSLIERLLRFKKFNHLFADCVIFFTVAPEFTDKAKIFDRRIEHP
jgi:hypothetical protein